MPAGHADDAGSQPNQESVHANEFQKNYKQIKFFQRTFPAVATGKIYTVQDLELPDNKARQLQWNRTLYSTDGKLGSLKEGDLIEVKKEE